MTPLVRKVGNGSQSAQQDKGGPLTEQFGGPLVVLTLLVLLPCSVEIRDGEGWSYSRSRLQELGQALRDYHKVFGRLPPAVVTNKEGRPLYSWRVPLLPFLELDDLHEQFHLDEPWDSPHNQSFLNETPRCYVPALGGEDPPGLTRYQVFVGPGTAFERPGLTWEDFPDGLSTTILVAEARDPVPWSKPADLIYSADKRLPPLKGPYSKPWKILCYEMGRTQGFGAVFADGSYRFFPSSTSEQTLRSLISRNGGEEAR